MRESIAQILENANFTTQTFSAPSEFLESYSQKMSGCLIIDYQLPEMNGLELYQCLSGCSLPFIVISGVANVRRVLASFRQGAVDFLEKPFGRAELLDRVADAMNRDYKARRENRLRADVNQRLQSLSPREREVMRLLAEGHEAKLIANMLGISPKTAHNHRARILEKMSVDNVPKLLRLLQGLS